MRSPILAALLHGTRAAAVSQTLRRDTRNGITELLQRAPPTFGWAAITLGIGPHSSLGLFFVHLFSFSTLCAFLVLVLFAFIVLGLDSSIPHQEIGWEERLRNDQCCVE